MPDQYLGANDRDTTGNRGVTLDRMPPSPPDRVKGRGDGGNRETPPSTPGLMALQGLEQIQKGMQLVSAALPTLPPILLQAGAIWLTQIQQAVTQTLAGGRQGPAPPSGILTPPAMAGGGPPPGIGAQGGAPGAPTPLPAGMGQ